MIRMPWGHGYWQRLLDQAVDGELTPAHQQRLDRHLSRCRRCQVELASLRHVRSLLSSLSVPDVPRSFALTPAMIEGSQRHTGRIWRMASLASQGVAIAAAVAFGVFLGLTFTDSQPQSPAVPEDSEIAPFAAAPSLSAASDQTAIGDAASPPGGDQFATPSAGFESATPVFERTEVGAAGVITPEQGGYIGPGVSPETRDTESKSTEETTPLGTNQIAPSHRIGAPDVVAPGSPVEQRGHRWSIRPLPFAVAAAIVMVAALGIAYFAKRRTE